MSNDTAVKVLTVMLLLSMALTFWSYQQTGQVLNMLDQCEQQLEIKPFDDLDTKKTEWKL